jgi:ABC-type multidrug transport system fused ATPase/permease subunit/GGDEF domain-containing protein
MRRYAHLLCLVFVSDVFVTTLGMCVPLFSVVVFDYAYPHRDLSIFTLVTVLGFGIFFLDFLVSSHIDSLNVFAVADATRRLTEELFERIERLPMRFHQGAKVGDLLLRLTDDVEKVIRFSAQFFTQIATQLVKLAVFLYITLSYDPTITGLALLSIPLYLMEKRFFTRRLERVAEDQQVNEAALYEGIESRLHAIRTIKACNQQHAEAQRVGRYVRRSFLCTLKESMIAVCNIFAESVTIQVWATFIAWYLGYLVIQGEISIGQVVALGIYLPMLEDPIRALAGEYSAARVALISMRRVGSILHESDEDPDDGSGKPLQVTQGTIEFRDVDFAYSPDQPVLTNFSLTIPAGTSVALVGESGSGKSTIVNLLMRFYDADRGAIDIDGQDIREVSSSSLRNAIGVVFQEGAIVEGTVRDNIAYGRTDINEAAIHTAARAASAHDFIQQLVDGYDTYIDAGGHGLSGGERQRIAIARALLHTPPLLIFDEATSALDAESEFLIQEAISRCIGSHTILIVAHRFSTIKKVDRIVVLRQGKIVESGTFQELLDNKGYFFRLYNLQTGGFQKFRELFEAEFQRYIRYDQELTLCMGQVQEISNLAGEVDGNALASLMEEINLLVRKNLRIMDFSAVYAEDKIVMALPETDIAGARAAIERVQWHLQEAVFQVGGVTVKPNVSIGVVACRTAGVRYGEDLFARVHEVLAKIPKAMSFGSEEL